MSSAREFRELLAADAALMLGIADAADVAAALQRYWARRSQPDVTFEAELEHIARLPCEAVQQIRLEVMRLLEQAGGNAQAAVTRRGGLDRSIHLALQKESRGLTNELSSLGIAIRAPLRILPASRYIDFEPAGEGGMGVVYAALDTEMNRRVALKMVRSCDPSTESQSHPLDAVHPPKDTPESDVFEQLKVRLVQEAWVTGGLEHPGIVPVYEIGQTPGGIPYYTMRYVRGDRTLADAILAAKGAPIEDRLALLEPFLKICDALRFAHDKGVIHRDLKPTNVALGQYGEVVLLDWGLASLEGSEDVTSSAWQARVNALRHDAALQTLEGGAVGTPGYMSPEAALGHLAEVDQHSDIYSLGVMLFEILTGRLPYEFRSMREYAALLESGAPQAAKSVDTRIPEPLSALCASAMAHAKASRPATVAELAQAIRGWQVNDTLEREAGALLRDARAALESADAMQGSARLHQVDRAAAAIAQVHAKRPAIESTRALEARAAALREKGIRERESASTRRLLRRVMTGVLAGASAAALWVMAVLDAKREEAEHAHASTRLALAEKEQALDDVSRLADAKRVRDLLSQVDELWPLAPGLADRMSAWLERAQQVLCNLDAHRSRIETIRKRALPYTPEEQVRDQAELHRQLDPLNAVVEEAERKLAMLPESEGALRSSTLAQASAARQQIERVRVALAGRRSWAFDDPAIDWQHQVLQDVLAGLSVLQEHSVGDITQRLSFVRELRARSVDAHAKAWAETIASIAASDRYGRMRLSPQVGLIPLGQDPDSGLYEFAHVGSGTPPGRDPVTKRITYTDDSSLVLVLLPAGSFLMGAQGHDQSKPNYDATADEIESPVHQVDHPAFFMAKHETTQAQWMAMTGGRDPSQYKAGENWGDRVVSLRNPVEKVSWDDCTCWLARHGLALPTEAQWEYACRAGTDTPWCSGRDVTLLSGVANIADEYARKYDTKLRVTPGVNDGHVAHAPVGSYRANAWGLHDMHGNVMEWCYDVWGADAYTRAMTHDPVVVSGSAFRLVRGGSYFDHAIVARSSSRGGRGDPGMRVGLLGCRAARRVEP